MKPVSIMLREGTMASHKAAEQTAFVKAFLQGSISRNAYAKHLALLRTVYAALENAILNHAADVCVSKIYFPELTRSAALDADLRFFRRSGPETSPGTEKYAARLNEIGQTKPWLLAAHSYVRYLGDLSGGQALKRVAQKALGLSREGLSFYEFPEIEDIAAFKNLYRERLDSLPLNETAKAELVAEAVHAFELNTMIFADLGSDVSDNKAAAVDAK